MEDSKKFMLNKFVDKMNKEVKKVKKTRRVCVKKKELGECVGDWLGDNHLYIGRKMSSFLTGSCNLPDSEWLNPFRVAKKKSNAKMEKDDFDKFYKRSLRHSYLREKGKGKEEWKFTLETSLKLFERYMRERLENEEGLKEKLLKLEGKKLGCYCLGKDKCHGDVLIKLIKELKEN